jgi:hypothetical protein
LPSSDTSEGTPPRERAPRHGEVLAGAASFVAFAAVSFYAFALARFALDVPVEDDVELLRFLLGDEGHGWLSLHNEHRPLTARLLFASTRSLLGALDHRFVMALGALALVGVAGVVARWLPAGDRADRLFAAAPIVVLLFTLQHWQAATWATGAAQHYPMLLCALLAIECLARPTPLRTALAAVLATLAFLNLGAGLFAFVVGLGLLLHARAWPLAAGFGAWAVLCTSLYFVGYVRPDHHPSPFAALGDPIAAFDYLCTLAGGGLSFDDVRVGWLARFAGWGLGLGWLVLATGSRWREDPRPFAAMTFVGLTLAAVTASRVGFGLDQAFDSRYRVYSHLLMALAFVALVSSRGLKASRNRSALVLLAAVGLSVASIPSAWARMDEHRTFYAENARDWARGRTMIPGPAAYGDVVRRAADTGVWDFPCAAVGAEDDADNVWCARD